MRERGGGIPQIVVVDDDPNALDRVARLVERRFGADYAVTAVRTAERALELVTEIEAGSDDVCMILAGYRMPETSGIELLRRCATIAPDARRVVLVGFGELNVARKEILKAAAIGEVDTYLQAPMVEPDEAFYRNVAALLEEWHRIHRPQFEQVRVVGDRWDANVHRIVDSLERSSIHVGFYDAATDAGRELLTAAAVDGELPIVMTWDGRWVSRPSQAQLADLLGVNDDPRGRTFDVIIVGAGPAGLAAAVYAASEGLHVLVVETEALGGQASTSSLIRNYLGFPRGLTGSDLTTRAYWQSWFFGAEFFFGRAAVSLRRNGDVYEMTLDDETVVRGKTVVLTSGVAYRRLGIESIEQFVGRGVFYGAPVTEAAGLLGDHVVVVGGGNSSAQSALYLARYASQVTLIVRRAQLDEMSA
jgi:thioredoxin reductase (NADPH)